MGVALTDKADKFFIIVQNGEKKSRQEFPTKEEALAFLPKVLALKAKAKGIRIMLRQDFGDGFLYAPHYTNRLYNKQGDLMINPFTHAPERDFLKRMDAKKGHLYCPECGFDTKFPQDSFRGIKICDCCGISTNDYYVKSCNGLWENVKKG